MKRLLLVTAVAASLTTAAHATTYDVSSNITGVQLYLGTTDIFSYNPGYGPPSYITGFKLGGTATDANDDGIIDSASLTLTGEAGFTASQPLKLIFNLGSGNFVAGSGTTFSSGTVQLDVYADVNPDDESGYPDFQWVPLSTTDASTTNLPFLAGQPGQLTTRDVYGNILTQPNTTAGLQLAPGTHALPGLWDGQIGSEGVNSSLTVMNLLGSYAGIFMEGTITLAPQAVPVPASVWLFGSALAGLVGAGRKRRAA